MQQLVLESVETVDSGVEITALPGLVVPRDVLVNSVCGFNVIVRFCCR
jgi:hypothetical protein